MAMETETLSVRHGDCVGLIRSRQASWDPRTWISTWTVLDGSHLIADGAEISHELETAAVEARLYEKASSIADAVNAAKVRTAVAVHWACKQDAQDHISTRMDVVMGRLQK